MLLITFPTEKNQNAERPRKLLKILKSDNVS